MALVTADDSGTPHFGSRNPETVIAEENDVEKNIEAGESQSRNPNRDCIPVEESACQEKITTNEILDEGCSEYGCNHYRRRCCIRAPCCNEIFDCRHYHNEAKNDMENDQKLRHDVPRHQIEMVICSLCDTEQEASKKQYHRNACGICKIACCYLMCMISSYLCVERAMHHNCPICLEYIFDSRDEVVCLLCGHTVHNKCFKDMLAYNQYTCPLCFMPVGDMIEVWEKFDEEIAATPMPAHFPEKMVCIPCNDCQSNLEVKFHFLGLKCPNCKSYNTC